MMAQPKTHQNNNRLRNKTGQMTVEIILVLAVIVAGAVTVGSIFRQQQFFANLVSGPWQSVAGLIQNGVWGTPEETMSKHPNQFGRVSTARGELPQ